MIVTSCFKGNISNVYCNLNMYSMIDTVLTIYRHDNETITNGNISNMYNSNMYATWYTVSYDNKITNVTNLYCPGTTYCDSVNEWY